MGGALGVGVGVGAEYELPLLPLLLPLPLLKEDDATPVLAWLKSVMGMAIADSSLPPRLSLLSLLPLLPPPIEATE